MIQEVLNTAHIHFHHAVLSVTVNDVNDYPTYIMNEVDDKPKFIKWIGPNFLNNTIVVTVTEDYDLNVLAAWLELYENA